LRPMLPRSATEHDRASTPLELLFDLCFVVAVAQASGRLHHALAENQVGAGLVGYGMVFFAIWWAWMTFSWFASAYDCDDVPYRRGRLARPAVPRVPPRVGGAGRRRAVRPGLGRGGRSLGLEPAPHRRAVRAVHPDRAWRVRPGRHPRHPVRPRRPPGHRQPV